MPSNNALLHFQNDQLQHQAGGGDQFLISKERLAEIVEINGSTQGLQQCDYGIQNIISALKTNIDGGIIGDQRDLLLRRKAFGSNSSLQGRPPQTTKRFRRFILDASRDTTIILLLCCAALSLVIGIKTDGLAEAAIDGALIFLAVSFVVTFRTIFKFFKARWMVKKFLKRKMAIWVVRNGKLYQIPESELVVGDILCLQTGDCVPADGIFINGDSFLLNDGWEMEKNCSNYSRNPSLFTGAKVVKGHCRMLVTSVGENTERSRLIRSTGIHQHDQLHDPKLQLLDAIDKHNSKLEKICLSLSLILLAVQLIRCFVLKPVQTDEDCYLDPKGVKNTMEDLMHESIKLMKKERSSKVSGFVTMLCVLLFTTRDGLPLAIFIRLLYASKKMKSCEAIVLKLPASATVGLVTTICTGKTTDSVLQYDRMAELWVGFNLVDDLQKQLECEIRDVFREGIGVHNSVDDRLEDMSLLAWARVVLGLNMEQFCGTFSTVQYEAFDKKLSCSIIKRGDSNSSSEADKVLHVHWKGEPELILSMCSHYYTADGRKETLDANKRIAFVQIVQHLLACSRYCFAFGYKQAINEEGEDVGFETVKKSLEHDLTLVGFVGLKNPYSPELREAIEDCRKSGIRIKLMVDDDINTARIIAVNSGILRPEDDDEITGAIIEAHDFRTSSEQDRMNMIDNIHVLAKATSADKLLMVQCLKQKGDVVAATASAIRDFPVFKEADVGLFVGHECANLCKEDGDIVLLGKKFSQIPGIVKVGRRVCENLEKLIKLQLTLEISAFAIIIISAAYSKEVLSSFQVLWINLIMEILGALAMAITTVHTQCSRTECVDPKLVYGSGAVITRSMFISIALQSLFQVSIILILRMKGKDMFGVKESVLGTMIFNCYAFCQVFLLLTGIELKTNSAVLGVFTGKSCLFLGITAVIGILQVAVVEIMRRVDHWSRLNTKQWCICVGIASLSVPLSCAENWIGSTYK